MENWVCWDKDSGRFQHDGRLRDLLEGLEEEGWCLACGEFSHKVACCPLQEEEELPARKKRNSGRSKRRAKEPEHPELHQFLAAKGELHQFPVTEGKPHRFPVTEGKPHQFPTAKEEQNQFLTTEGEAHQSLSLAAAFAKRASTTTATARVANPSTTTGPDSITSGRTGASAAAFWTGGSPPSFTFRGTALALFAIAWGCLFAIALLLPTVPITAFSLLECATLPSAFLLRAGPREEAAFPLQERPVPLIACPLLELPMLEEPAGALSALPPTAVPLAALLLMEYATRCQHCH
ncbi:UNVERIFIED_CONTAM: hypothetical protein FKN15_067228 [Acipenser sinensis]